MTDEEWGIRLQLAEDEARNAAAALDSAQLTADYLREELGLQRLRVGELLRPTWANVLAAFGRWLKPRRDFGVSTRA